ncbi:MAG: nicotinate-nicotinamide nucleotide adenylyltransferase [Phycisphaerales bacterium]|jgi:nicotinate-nucleotide adenylyltransferase|nr:nicotinate-nicotinamide nucleotide adenylyltransferase [Phycisphaerales bacterium]
MDPSPRSNEPDATRITPLPAAPPGAGVLLFGGTFDPPHRAHIALARAAQRELARRGHSTTLVFVPAARSPFKPGGPEASGEERARMLVAAMREREAGEVPPIGLGNGAEPMPWGVWTDEIDRADAGEASYWVDTLRRARTLLDAQQRADARLWFIVGTDQALSLHQWREPHEILRLARPIVLARASEHAFADKRVDPAMRARFMEQLRATGAWSDEEMSTWGEALLEGQPLLAHRATDAREALARGASDDELRSLLHHGVLAIIRERGLYGASAAD